MKDTYTSQEVTDLVNKVQKAYISAVCDEVTDEDVVARVAINSLKRMVVITMEEDLH